MNQQKGEMTIIGRIIGICIMAIYVTGLIVGIMYISECTIDIFIPIWLIGKLPIYTLCCLVYHWKQLPSKYLTKSVPMMVIAGIIIQVEIIWQLAGTFNIVFIMPSYNSDNTDSWQYCNTVLYHTSLSIMIVSWLFYISLILFLIQQSKTTNPVQNQSKTTTSNPVQNQSKTTKQNLSKTTNPVQNQSKTTTSNPVQNQSKTTNPVQNLSKTTNSVHNLSKTTNPVQNNLSEEKDNSANKTKENSKQQRTSKAEIRRIQGTIKQERKISNKKR